MKRKDVFAAFVLILMMVFSLIFSEFAWSGAGDLNDSDTFPNGQYEGYYCDQWMGGAACGSDSCYDNNFYSWWDEGVTKTDGSFFGSCCGDDSDEYYTYFDQYWPDSNCNDITVNACVGTGDNINDENCCTQNSCVYGLMCYANKTLADVDGDGVSGEFCFYSEAYDNDVPIPDQSGKWRDCDSSQDYCIDTEICSFNWTIGGESESFGEYNAGDSIECCGDDAFEYLKSRIADGSMDGGYSSEEGDYACCDEANDCINSSVCYSSQSTAYADSDQDLDYCFEGEWYDCYNASQCLEGYGCIENNCVDVTAPLSPFLWNPTNFTKESSINIYGYVNESGIIVSIDVLDNVTNEVVHDSYTTDVLANLTASDNTTQYFGTDESRVLIPDRSRYSDYFSVDRFVSFSNHFNSYMLHYDINRHDDIGNEVQLNFTKDLDSAVPVNTTVYGWDSLYPSGWFNFSINLFSGMNVISVQGTDPTGNQGNASYLYIIYDISPPEINTSRISTEVSDTNVTFEIKDNYGVNLTTLLLNVSYEGSSEYYYTNDSAYDMQLRKNITCIGEPKLMMCNVDLNLSEGRYNLTFYLNDSAAYHTSKTIGLIIDESAEELLSLNDTGDIISSLNLTAFWSSYNDSYSTVDHYEYAIGTAVYPSDGWDAIVNWTNTTNTNVTTEILDLEHGIMYFFNLRALSNAGTYTEVISSDGIVYVDNTPPNLPIVADAGIYTGTDTEIWGSWIATDDEAGISNYEVSIGTAIYPYTGWNSLLEEVVGNVTEKTFEVDMQQNTTYFFNVRARNTYGAWGERQSSNGIKVDITFPYNGTIIYESGLNPDDEIRINISNGIDLESGISKAELWMARLHYHDGECQGTYIFDTLIQNALGISSVDYSAENGYCYKFMLLIENGAGLKKEYYTYSENYNGTVLTDSTEPGEFTVTDEGSITYNRTLLSCEWEEAQDNESGIDYYSYRISYAINNGQKITLINWTENGLQNNVDSSLELVHSNITHQYKYYFDVRAYNKNGLYTQMSSDGIIYLDILPPVTSLLRVEGETAGPFEDTVADGVTNITVIGEEDMICVYSEYDIDFSLSQGTLCDTINDRAECLVVGEDGDKEYHITCKDKYGNGQDYSHNVDVSVFVDQDGPDISLVSPIADGRYNESFILDADILDSGIGIIEIVSYEIFDLFNDSVESGNLISPDYNITIGLPSPGRYLISLYAEDSLGHNNSVNEFIYVNSSLPLLEMMDERPYMVLNTTYNMTLVGQFANNISVVIRNSSNSIVLSDSDIFLVEENISFFEIELNFTNLTYWKKGNYSFNYSAMNDNGRTSGVFNFILYDEIVHNIFSNSSENLSVRYNYLENLSVFEGRIENDENITLINATFTFDIYQPNRSFMIRAENLSVSENPIFNISFRDLNESEIQNSTLYIGNNKRYRVRSSYAVSVVSEPSREYRVMFNLSNLSINDENRLVIFKFGYDMINDSINFSGSEMYENISIDGIDGIVGIEVSNFSAFVLCEDLMSSEVCDGIDNDYDGEIDEGGVCPTESGSSSSSSGSRSSGGSGGSGGAGTVMNLETCNDNRLNQDESDIDCGGICDGCVAYKFCRSDDDCLSGFCHPNNGYCVEPNCNDGMINQDEEGIDCGGSCEDCANCYDGIQNQDEEMVDCGGTCSPCPTCYDGIKNQNEEEIDCGGTCSPCPTCYDGIKNQDEEEIDCGGKCDVCIFEEEPKSFSLLVFVIIGGVMAILLGGSAIYIIANKKKKENANSVSVLDKDNGIYTDGPLADDVIDPFLNMPKQHIPLVINMRDILGGIGNFAGNSMSGLDAVTNLSDQELLLIQAEANNNFCNGMPIDEIKISLENKGLLSHVVEDILNDIPDKDIQDSFISLGEAMEKESMSNNDRLSLLGNGCDKDMIDMVKYNVHIITDKKHLQNYISNKVAAGIDEDQIYRNLSKAGWPRRIVIKSYLDSRSNASRNIGKIKTIADSMFKEGMCDDEVKVNLLDKGFSEDLVDLMIYKKISRQKKVKDLTIYMNHMIKDGNDPSSLRDDLYKKGWPIDILDQILSDRFLDENSGALKEMELIYSKGIEEGKDVNEIRRTLEENGWSEAYADLFLYGVQSPESDVKRLKRYMNQRLFKGNNPDEIKEILLNIGWKRKTIDDIYDNRL